MTDELSELRERLDALAKSAGTQLQKQRGLRALRAALRPASSLLLAALVLLVVGRLVALFLELELPLPARPLGVLAALGGVAGWMLLQGKAARDSELGRGVALNAIDRELGLEDRLSAADDFLERGPISDFEQAALRDAARHLATAESVRLPDPVPSWRLDAAERALAASAAVLALVALLVPGPGGPALEGEEELVADAGGAPVARNATPERVTPEPPTAPPTPDEGRAEQPVAAGSDPTARQDSSVEGEESKESVGMAGSGRSSGAQSTSGAGPSRGAPSNQSQESDEREPREPKQQRTPEARPPADQPPRDPRTAEEDSGATAGMGSARGSNRNPTASNWQSRDQQGTPDEEDIDDDTDIEDEDEEQENRGGMQPNLRDRKPPVSRDLRIGFGNNANPDANGRGGPSEQKKSRGTASLVLGVPVPDRVRGQPNPGRTRITQERVEPREEDAGATAAEERVPRAMPSGPVARASLQPWMRSLVSDYFDSYFQGIQDQDLAAGEATQRASEESDS